MGGLDSRYLLSPANEKTTSQNDISLRIASLTTISTPHRGSPIADFLAFQPATESAKLHTVHAILNRLSGLEDAVRELLDHFGLSVDALKDLTTQATLAFNQRYPDHPRIRYLSVAGAGRDGLMRRPRSFCSLVTSTFELSRPKPVTLWCRCLPLSGVTLIPTRGIATMLKKLVTISIIPSKNRISIIWRDTMKS